MQDLIDKKLKKDWLLFFDIQRDVLSYRYKSLLLHILDCFTSLAMTSFTDTASLLLAILLSSLNKKMLVRIGMKSLNKKAQKSHQKFAK